MKKLWWLALVLVGPVIAGQTTVNTITLQDPYTGTTLVVSELPGLDGGLGFVLTLPGGAVYTGTGQSSPQPDGSWHCTPTLTRADMDGSGILPKEQNVRIHAHKDHDDGVPDEEGGELELPGSQLGRGARPLFY